TLLAVGCAMGGSGPSDEELVQDLVNRYLAAMKAADLDAAFELYFDDYEGTFGDKEDAKTFLENAKGQGYLDSVEFDVSELAITIDGASAHVAGIVSMTDMATADVELELAKRGGAWGITGSQVDY
ncbi:MAG: nuclear transport factor 2 family protein, partial [bacterium]|nr:nuclear transport factor 2 family protein [bacterium]